MKFYRFFVPRLKITVAQGKFRSERQAKNAAQQLSSSMPVEVEFEEIFELSPDLPLFTSDESGCYFISIFILGTSFLVLLLGILLFQAFLPNQAAKVIEPVIPSKPLSK